MKSLTYFLLLTFIIQSSSAATHSLRYFYTAVTSGINFPEFTVVGQVDGQQIVYYDSDDRKMTPKTDWIKKVADYDPDYWDRQTQGAQGDQEVFKVNVQTAMQRFNQTKGVHTVQWMYGCELDDDGTKRGYDQYGYDGLDFISLDLNTVTWTAPTFQAVISKQKLEKVGEAKYVKNYLENGCIEWLEKYLGYRAVLERKVSPDVSLFQKDSSSPVVCHATGFFPKAVMISWQKNGEELNEDVDLRETLPNQDGTFQKRSILNVSPEELKNNKYTCVVQHSSLEKELVRKFEPAGGMGVIVGAVVAVLLLVLVAVGVGVVVWKKKKSGFKFVPVNPNGSTDGENSSTNS
ncbi:H-2 class I histocompatibility antigen, Q9 alpha chain-like [Astyanax mexicanus]|uniref:H-2 class I histocompatibility antigen, Q9 alpha chain-like n=1 Tax=Astyanax mexicanus TaxID=7994 RepID=UPI0020CB0F21|nr:H-2 class I histocompatibility antigen, Q9 alpha chain-like [Astyanax mexicanus]